MIGRVIGNYRIDALLGQGGMGAVYCGLDLMLDRPVAIKALRADVASQPHLVERFRQEARVLARLLHPNIATLYTLVRDGDALYMVMEFCEGETLESILRRRGRLDPAEALPLYTQALDGLSHAHRHGIVHRDIKPANLMRLPDGTVKVMDFGIARLLGSSRMTQTSHTVGTTEYMAPEQIRAQDVDARTDVYALGVLLFELLTGRVPFQSESFFEVMQAHLQQEPPPPRQFAPAMPEALEAAILRALAKKPEDRFPSVDALRDALAAIPLAAVTAAKATVVAPRPAAGTAEPPAPAKKAKGRRKKAAEPAPTVVADRPAAPGTIRDPESTQPAPTAFAPASTAVSTSPAALETAATPAWKRYAPHAALGVGGLGLLLAVGVWAFSPGPSPEGPPAEPEEAVETADADFGEAITFDRPLPPPPTTNPIGTSPATIQAWLATARALLDAGSLTTPADSNALLFAERVLAVSPGHAEANGVVRSIAQRYVAMGDRAWQRRNGRAARSHYQQAIAVADRHRGVANEARAAAQRGLQTMNNEAALAAQEGPGQDGRSREGRPERREATPAEPAAPATGTVRVLVRPYGDVYVDGRRHAGGTNAPVSVEVPPGAHRVRATHPTLGTQERSVSVTAGRTAEVFIEFATPAEVTVVSDPIHAEIFLDGRSTGRYTPATITVPPGTHTVEVRKDGHRSASRSVTVEAGSTPGRVSLTLTPED